jgi:hypothetical protein
MRVYKIYTGLTEDQFSDLNDMLDSSEVYMVETLQDQVLNVDIVENGLVSSYLICDEKSLDFIVSLLYKYEVKFKLKDITKIFLYGQVTIDDIDFQNFLKENLDIDTILDKINEVGIDYLSDLDIFILNKKV